MTHPVAILGVVGGEVFGHAAATALAAAEVLVGSKRQIASLAAAPDAIVVDLAGPLPAVFDQIDTHRAAGRRVVILASGDPGFFGIARTAQQRFGADGVSVYPAPSSVSLAFARLGERWEDAVVTSAHGRPLADALRAIGSAAKVAVLTSPENTPQVVGRAVASLRPDLDDVLVATRLGEAGECVQRMTLGELAAGEFDPMSVVILRAAAEGADAPTVAHGGRPAAFGRAVEAFDHRDGMITKPEVRAIALAKLALPATGVLWDVGAGSGSVGVEASVLAPALRVIAVERDPADAARIGANAARHNASVEVIVGAAPAALAVLPDPDRVFVGGGGLGVLTAAFDRLRPGGVAVATFALADRALAAYQLLGGMVQVTVNTATPLGDGVHLNAANPVFVAWGTK